MENITFEFRIKYDTKIGEQIYIFGDNEKFGNWKNKIFKLEWSENNIWKKEFKININDKNIEYKFVCCNDNGNVIWEKGPNRILDPKNISHLKKENGKYILEQKWESFTIKFNINYHIESPDCIMMILGNNSSLGEWNKNNSNNKFEERKMILEIDERSKIKDFWRKGIDIFCGDDNLKEIDLEYKYIIYDIKNKTEKFEEGINRHVKILFKIDENNDEQKFFYLTNPMEYKLLLNSIIEINDSNFIIKK